MSRSTKGHDLYKLCSTTYPDATCQVSRHLAQWFWRRRFFKVLSIFEHGGHLGHVTWIIYINFVSPFLRRLHIKFGFDWSCSLRGEDVWKVWTDGRTTDTGPWVYYKLTLWAWRLRWAKKPWQRLFISCSNVCDIVKALKIVLHETG